METRDSEGDRGGGQYMTDLENALPQKNLSPSYQERVEEGWEAVI